MSDIRDLVVENETIMDVKDGEQKCIAFIPFYKGMIWKFIAMGGNGILISSFDGLLQVIIQPEQLKEIFGEEEDE